MEAATRQQLHGVPITASHFLIPTLGSSSRVAEPWNNGRSSGSTPQLTIFYAGNVIVFDDISPDKVQDIMFLARNGSSVPSNTAYSKAQVQGASPKLETGNVVSVSEPFNAPPCTGLLSPISVSSHGGAQSRSGSTSTDEPVAVKTTGTPAAPVCKEGRPDIGNGGVSVSAISRMPSAVPQARKASLARFFEKRKERAMKAAPYNLAKKPAEHETPESAYAIVSPSPAADM